MDICGWKAENREKEMEMKKKKNSWKKKKKKNNRKANKNGVENLKWLLNLAGSCVWKNAKECEFTDEAGSRCLCYSFCVACQK